MALSSRWAAAALLAAACGASEPALAPIIDAPDPGLAADPFVEIDTLELAVARAGAAGNLAAQSVARGETPVLSSVPFGDDLVLHLSGTSGGTQLAYGRSCAFSFNRDHPPPAPHLYFSRIVKWAPGQTPARPARTGGAAYSAPDGSAVFVGGDGGETEVERYLPLEARFAPAGTSAARRGAVLAPLPDGRALRIGGIAVDAEGPVAFFELLSPATGRVDAIPDDRLRVIEHAAATLVDGSVVVIGGRAPDAGGVLQTTGATWSLQLGDAGAPDRPRRLTATLAVARAGHTATRMGDELGAAVLVVGGRDADGAPVATAEIYEPLREGYAAFRPTMVRARADHRAVRMPDGSILIVGGRDGSGARVDTVELYLPRIGQFIAAATMPAAAGLTDMSVTPLPDGRVLLAGGKDRNGAPVASSYIARLDPIDGTVDIRTQTDSLAVPRAGHAAALLCDGTVLVVGGSDDPTAPGSERYNPPAAGRR